MAGREDRQGPFDDVLLLVGDRLVQGSVYRLLAEHGDALSPGAFLRRLCPAAFGVDHRGASSP